MNVAHAGLLLLAAVAVLSGAAYAYVAHAIRARPTQDAPARRANRLFSWWWDGLATLNALTTAALAPAAFDAASPPLVRALMTLSIGVACFAFASLVHYLLYVATGTSRPLRWIFLYYVVAFVATIYLVSWMHLQAVGATTWSIAQTFANQPPVWVIVLDALALVAPPVVATARYVLLYPLVDQTTIRYRIALTAVAICAWLAIVLVSPLIARSEASAAQPAVRAVAFLAAALTLLAYEPPPFIRRRYRVRALRDERVGAT